MHSLKHSVLVLCIGWLLSIQIGMAGRCYAQVAPADPHQTVRADVPSRHDLLKERYDFNRHTLVDAYQEHGSHDPAWDRDAIELLELFAVLFTYGDHEPPIYTSKPIGRARKQFRSVPELIDSLERSACIDPMVLYLIGFHYSQDTGVFDIDRIKKSRDLFSQSFQAFKGSGYSAFRKYNCLTRCLKQSKTLGHSKELRQERAPWYEQLSSHTIAALKEASQEKNPSVRDLLVQQICAPLEILAYDFQPRQTNYLTDFIESLDPIKESDPWAYHTARGTLLVKLAWMHRGSGFANTVKPEQWKQFESCLTQASNNLSAAWESEPSTHVANQMIKVAMAGYAKPEEDSRFWFDRSIALSFDNPDAWQGMYTALLPRWGGSHEAMLDLALEALNTGRFDTATPEQFLLILSTIDAERGDGAVWRVPAVRDGLDRLASGMAEQRDEESRLWYKILRAAYMWKCGDFEKTVQAIEAVGPLEADTLAIAELVFQSESFDLDVALNTSYALTSSIANDIMAAFEVYGEGKSEEAIAQLTALHKETKGLHPRAHSFLSSQISALIFYQNFSTGEWITIDKPDDLNTLWQQLHGSWAFDEQGRLVGKADQNGLALIFRHPISGPWELSCEFEIVQPAPEGWSNAGIIFGYLTPTAYSGHWIFPESGQYVQAWGQGDRRQSRLRQAIDPGQKHYITHKLNTAGKVTATIGDHAFIDRPWFEALPSHQFGLSSTIQMKRNNIAPEGIDKLQVRYSNIRVRMLIDE